MGWKHVIPQFILRALEARDRGDPAFPIQGDGRETRAFAYVDDVVDGILRMNRDGGHREIYHIGNDHEVAIRELAAMTGRALGMDLNIRPGPAAEGGTDRRCPDISKMRGLGYAPAVPLKEGLRRTAEWYEANPRPHPGERADVRSAQDVADVDGGVEPRPYPREPRIGARSRQGGTAAYPPAPVGRDFTPPWQAGPAAAQWLAKTSAAPSLRISSVSYGSRMSPMSIPGEPAGMPGTVRPSASGLSASSRLTSSAGTWPSTT